MHLFRERNNNGTQPRKATIPLGNQSGTCTQVKATNATSVYYLVIYY